MNQTFSLRRFTQLNRWFWAANSRTYSLGLLALLAITTALLGRVVSITGYDAAIASENVPYFKVLMLVSISLLSSQLISALHDQYSALSYLMLPASRTEKFAVLVEYLFLFIVGYSLFYRAVEVFFFRVANSHLPSAGNLYKSLLSPSEHPFVLYPSINHLFLLTAVIGLLGSLYFRQGVLVKNSVLLLSLFMGMGFLYKYTISVFFSGLEIHASNFLSDLYASPKGQYAKAPRLVAPYFVSHIFPWLYLIALWITARIRFNEIER